MKRLKVRYYTKENCPLCEEGLEVLKLLESDFPMDIEEIDIYSDDALLEKYMLKIPVVEADEQELAYGKISWAALSDELSRLIKKIQ